MPTIMSKIFDKKMPQELLTSNQSCKAWSQIQEARALKNATLPPLSPCPARVHVILTVLLALCVVSIIGGVWSAVLCCNQSDSARAESCFTAALWSSGAFAVLVLAKCWANSRFPQF